MEDINVALYITTIAIGVVLFIFILSNVYSKRIPRERKIELFKQLSKIKSSILINNPYSNRDAVIRMDNILSKALQYRFDNEDTCGENLKLARRLFRKDRYELIWKYHKLRNSIVHENVEVSHKDALKAYSVYTTIISKILD